MFSLAVAILRPFLVSKVAFAEVPVKLQRFVTGGNERPLACVRRRGENEVKFFIPKSTATEVEVRKMRAEIALILCIGN